jgi:Mg-chelatase subunit ChlD
VAAVPAEAGAVMVLLTDGLPNRVPPGPGSTMEETVLARAASARGAGTRIFTVGLGLPDDVLRGLLAGVAGSPLDYYYAPDAADLAGIYRQIAGRITECP